MRQGFSGRTGHRSGLLASVLLALVMLAACGGQQPTPTVEPQPTTIGRLQATIEVPQANQTIGSPFELRGQVLPAPAEGRLLYQITDAAGNLVGSGPIEVATTGTGASFDTEALYSTAGGGAGQVALYQIDGAQPLATVPVNLLPGQDGGTAPPPTSEATGQAITIDTPAPGTVVGSPLVITGRTAQFPFQGMLNFRITDQGGNQVGSGTFNVVGATGEPTSFTASLSFREPPGGGPIRVAIFDQNPASGAVVATAAIELTVAPQQSTTRQIIIDTPPPGTEVGNPVVITGRTARYPFQGTLGYRVVDANGTLLGSGVFNVSGQPDQPGSFSASLDFNLPPAGGPIRVELLDQNAANGEVAATAAINLLASASQPPGPPPQLITILSPPDGTQVGSPMVVTGQTARFPFEGNVQYRFLDQNGNQIGTGNITVSGQPGGPAAFNSQISFTEPDSAGRITLEIFEQDAGNGAIIASSSRNLQFQPPQGQQPTPIPGQPQQPGNPQVLTIETPAAGTVVASPVVVTGRSTRTPAGNQLFYQVLDANQQPIGRGAFNVAPQPTGTARFNVSIPFNEPTGGGAIMVVILDQDAAGQSIARASVNLTVAPPPVQPTPPSAQPGPPAQPGPSPALPSPLPPEATPSPAPTEQVPPVISIEAPEPDTAVTSPFTLTGRVSQLPSEGNLAYRVYDAERNIIGEGSIMVEGTAGQIVSFEARIEFVEQPTDAIITVEIYEEDTAGGEIIASAGIELRVGGP
jgi:hypothetical protein